MKILRFSELASTNQQAKKIAETEEGREEWVAVTAGRQSAGYGKDKRYWYSPSGGLYFSIIIPKLKISDLQILTIGAGIAVSRVLKKHFGIKPFLKWPNDVLVQDSECNYKKIAGILAENVIKGKEVKNSIIGIGLNTNISEFPSDLTEIATSLKKEYDKEADNGEVLALIAEELKEILKLNKEEILKEYTKSVK